jgi:hydroxymethylglutaryl-CoA synthase
VPEFKHACLGGVYAMKAVSRYLAVDGRDKIGIVVCADIAEYERGSSGEQTQGAGAVAMLLEPQARLFELDLKHTGSASAYRGPDFRKPHARHFVEGYGQRTQRLHDFPIFSGKYSTYSYVDETLRAFDDMAQRLGVSASQALASAEAAFFHRPYHHMPVQAAACIYARGLIDGGGKSTTLAALCQEGGASREAFEAESKALPDLFDRVLEGKADQDPFPVATQVVGALRKSEEFKAFVAAKMSLGSRGAAELGNLYTAALPAWMAAGFEEALGRSLDLAGKRVLAIGYGSGDAAEAMPTRVTPGWTDAARRIGFARSLESFVDLSQDQYESLNDTRRAAGLPNLPGDRFRIARVGDRYEPGFQDLGIEYYEYVR